MCLSLINYNEEFISDTKRAVIRKYFPFMHTYMILISLSHSLTLSLFPFLMLVAKISRNSSYILFFTIFKCDNNGGSITMGVLDMKNYIIPIENEWKVTEMRQLMNVFSQLLTKCTLTKDIVT